MLLQQGEEFGVSGYRTGRVAGGAAPASQGGPGVQGALVMGAEEAALPVEYGFVRRHGPGCVAGLALPVGLAQEGEFQARGVGALVVERLSGEPLEVGGGRLRLAVRAEHLTGAVEQFVVGRARTVSREAGELPRSGVGHAGPESRIGVPAQHVDGVEEYRGETGVLLVCVGGSGQCRRDLPGEVPYPVGGECLARRALQHRVHAHRAVPGVRCVVDDSQAAHQAEGGVHLFRPQHPVGRRRGAMLLEVLHGGGVDEDGLGCTGGGQQ
ncbi:hypothetical protein AB0G54_24845 [Streptomyces yokosukanensis]|uniref:hypothetical protein n=1 Tax=Streptomyces yokosukanensis TaxID=67386 RepID=UPI00343B5825